MNNLIRCLLALSSPLFLFTGCVQPLNTNPDSLNDDECVIIGDIENLKNGRVEAKDELNDFRIIARGRAKDGKFVIKTKVHTPTYVYLYSSKNGQIRDFFLEPGLISVSGDADEDVFSGAAGTACNELWKRLRDDVRQSASETVDSIEDIYLRNAPSDLFKYKLAEYRDFYSSEKKLEIIQGLDSGLLAMPGVKAYMELLSRRVKVEPGRINPVYINVIQPDADGNMISLEDVVKKPGNRYVLLDFWATWCDACKQEMPYVKKAYEQYHSKGFDIYACSLNSGGGIKIWKEYVKGNGLVWTNVCDGEYTSSKAYKDYALQGIPDNVLIDCSDGRIIFRSLRGDKLLDCLSTLLDSQDCLQATSVSE